MEDGKGDVVVHRRRRRMKIVCGESKLSASAASTFCGLRRIVTHKLCAAQNVELARRERANLSETALEIGRD